MELPALSRPGRAALVAAGLWLAAAAWPQGVVAQEAARTTVVAVPQSDEPPPDRRQSSRDVISAALAVPKIRELRRENPDSYVRAYKVDSSDGLARGWQVSVFARERGPDDEIGQVILSDETGEAVEAYTGFQVEWSMARGYPGAFGRKVNAPYVWIPLLVLFLLPFLRPPWRLLHLDLLVLCAFSVSYAVFGTGHIGISVPLAYPCLVYLLVRMLAVARRRAFHVKRSAESARPLELLTTPAFLGMGIIFLLGFRLGLNFSSSNVIDVGYSGVIGADLLAHGETLYGGFPADNPRGDTYGPVNYLAYLPFEQIFPWKGVWDELPGAHAAAVAFDLASAALIFLLGLRIRGRQLGVLLAYLWLAFPFTLLVSNSNANDSLVAALVMVVLLAAIPSRSARSRPRPAIRGPLLRGAAVAAAGLTKFAPLLLAPLVATFPAAAHGADEGRGELAKRAALTLLATVVVGALLLLPAWLGDGGIVTFYDRTLAFQADRPSPFSLWGYFEGDLDVVQRVLEAGVIVLALVVAFVPRRRDAISLAALAAAILIAAQIVVTHWFYLYIVWFFPLVIVALLGDLVDDPADAHTDADDIGGADYSAGRRMGSIESARPG